MARAGADGRIVLTAMPGRGDPRLLVKISSATPRSIKWWMNCCVEVSAPPRDTSSHSTISATFTSVASTAQSFGVMPFDGACFFHHAADQLARRWRCQSPITEVGLQEAKPRTCASSTLRCRVVELSQITRHPTRPTERPGQHTLEVDQRQVGRSLLRARTRGKDTDPCGCSHCHAIFEPANLPHQ